MFKTMRAGPALLVAVLLALAIAATARGDNGDHTYDCELLVPGTAETDSCAESEPGGPLPAPSCRTDAEGVFWTGTDWVRLATALAADRSPCADYWVSLPPLAANKRGLRVLQDDIIRALGIHPVAEFTTGEITGWSNWVKSGHTWFEAGVEFRRAMAAAGYSGPEETWLLNEMDRTTMRDGPREGPDDQPWPPVRRAEIVELLQGLYYGAIGMEPLPGLVEIGIHFRHQNIPNVAQYKGEAEAWLEDGAFWTAISPMVRWLGVETYPDTRYWGVPGSSRDERRGHTEEYVFHLLDLVRSGPASVAPARDFFERAYLPFLNAGYRARGGEQFNFRTGHGNTIVDAATMQHFVSEQVYAVRHYSGSHPRGAPAGRLGFSWQPCNRSSATDPNCAAVTPAFVAALDAITARIAESIHYAYRQGGASPAGACAPPGADVKWCDGSVPGAAFTDAWEIFDRWN
jgi:hypothetical protein